jgi:hypothetical protein
MNDDDDPITITLRCRVKNCGYQKAYLPKNPSDLLPVLKGDGWRFAQKGKRTLPVCAKHYLESYDNRWCYLINACDPTPNRSDPKIPKIIAPMMKRIIMAGIDAMAHFTINPTIDPNGM